MTWGERFKEFFLPTTVLVVAVLAADAIVFLYYDPVSFQRFGSLIVALAVIFLPRAIRRINRFESDISTVELLAKTLTENEDLQSQILDHKREILSASKVIVAVEVGLIVLGTVQWGYGDKVHCTLHGMGWNSCG